MSFPRWLPFEAIFTEYAAMQSKAMVNELQPAFKLLDSGREEEAKNMFFKRAKEIVGPSFRIPSIGDARGGDGVRCQLYIDMEPQTRTALMACCIGLAKYYSAKDDIESALCWLEESSIIDETSIIKQTEKHPGHDWRVVTLEVPELTFQRVETSVLASKLFNRLGNTGTGTQRIWDIKAHWLSLGPAHKPPAMKELIDSGKASEGIRIRNPEPSLCHKLEVTHPRLQVLGSWKKLSAKRGTKAPGGRFDFASCIWNHHFYVFGGRYSIHGNKYHTDFWCLNLEADDAEMEWRKLPDHPFPKHFENSCAGMVVNEKENRAYLITGRPDVDYFDFVTERWGTILTSFKATDEDRECGVKNNWPFPGYTLHDAAVLINNGKVYTFGGSHDRTIMGCNLFMELDLATRKWKRLSGLVEARKDGDYSCPGPRVSPCAWVGPSKDRIYIFMGHANRDAAILLGEIHASSQSYAYTDFWSWSIPDAKWRRERVSGNCPTRRTEMAHTFNEKLNKVVAFGGFCPSIPTFFPASVTQFEFTYYADTFIYDYPRSGESNLPSYTDTDPKVLTPPSTTTYPRWRQVLTRGFPTYRCNARMHTDPDTGKMYLFGGFTNQDWVPGRKGFVTRPFGDMWQLRVDVPGEGGDFGSVDVEMESRTAKVGPWERCFTCGNTGWWKKCSGSCRGKAFFCSVECQREGWHEHKALHSCRKI